MARVRKPVIYFVFRTNTGPTSTRFGGFVARLKKAGHMPDADYRSVALEDLMFTIDLRGIATITDREGNEQFSDASFVYFKSWEALPEIASMVVSYLRAKGIPFEDAAVGHAGVHKPSQTWKLWAAGVPVIPTISSWFAPSEKRLTDTLGNGPYIIKPAKGEKGRGISKADSYADVIALLAEHPSDWLIQPFIANEGDYRVMTYGYEVSGALYRKGRKGSIVNNTSQGGTSDFVDANTLDKNITNVAIAAARAVEHAVAGVDVVVDQAGIPRVLEVNQGSQIVTGHHTDKKMAAFGDFITERISDRYSRRQPNNRLTVIGRYVHVNLPELGIKQVFAKVDTGAYQSAIHATNIREVETESGVVLEFTVLEGHKTADTRHAKTSTAHEYEKVVVRNSFGVKQVRYVIKTRISINGRMMKTGITLTDRKDMISPILLGRRFLRGRYLVNVEMGARGTVEDE